MPLSTLLRCSTPTGTDSTLCCARFAGGWFGAHERGSVRGLVTRVLGTPGKKQVLRLQTPAASGCRPLSRVLWYFPWMPGENVKLRFRAPRWFRAGVPQQRGCPDLPAPLTAACYKLCCCGQHWKRGRTRYINQNCIFCFYVWV